MSDGSPVPAGVIIWTEAERFEQLVGFYEATLGMSPTNRRAEHVSFSHGEFRLILGVHDEIAGPSTDPLRVMINLIVPDIHAAVDGLPAALFVRHPEREAWGGWIATLRDPDGNTVQLLQLPE